MPDLTPHDIHAATDTLSRLTDYLRKPPEPAEALALVEPLLDENTGIAVQLGDALRELARVVLAHPATASTPALRSLVAELREAAWEQIDQRHLHYVLDTLRALLAAPTSHGPGCCRCR
ncbi:hypothetical protein [Streptomyces leeuwenhoekii]|uniref:Uncharacterized protein n=1 Tax=Streptomyces leeuwenhoekii TaxID=1437453 RepID=A0A0F7VNW5_STRLW|nr:hypothetical protein [Streptomyces leeuwenhoekii]CQR61859.1 Hypothetical Protein SCAB [Streptomyces leeuwenhoekii]